MNRWPFCLAVLMLTLTDNYGFGDHVVARDAFIARWRKIR